MTCKSIPIVIYLPQYYETPENNEWWGKGYTDWSAVKSAEPCYEGHRQPVHPLNDEYYDLLQKSTMEQQAKLAKKYGIGGFSFYHYYFKNGKKVLEKPAENLLKWHDINMPFFFNWASESWIRTWSRVSGNVWGERFDDKNVESGNGILLEQDYGTEKDWIEHFDYLLPFFKDERYIKENGCPVFVFYSPEDISCFRKMTECWRKLARENGFPDMFIIGAHLTTSIQGVDAALVYEPRNAFLKLNKKQKVQLKNGVRCFDYQDVCDEIATDRKIYGLKTFFCAVSGYDDTPRRGYNGECMINRDEKLFSRQLISIADKSQSEGCPFYFINAWNEWGEGMYLEPDAIEKYKYLEVIKAVSDMNINTESGSMESNIDLLNSEIVQTNYELNKYKYFFALLLEWIEMSKNDKAIRRYFEDHNIKTVSIYGAGKLGKFMFRELTERGIKIDYMVDRYVGQINKETRMYRPEEKIPETDLMIISAFDYEEVLDTMKKQPIKEIKSMKQFISEIENSEAIHD